MIMGNFSKIHYTQDQIDFSSFAKALSHPARIRILGLLYKRSPQTCGQLVKFLPLSQPSVSQHLKELSKSGLVSSVHKHPKVEYYFEDKSFEIGVRVFKNVILKEIFDEHIKKHLND